MKHTTLLLLSTAALSCTGLSAQTYNTTAPAPQAQTKSTKEKAIEHIRTEDDGARIDETRVGGQTQSISVQPKADMPAYEVKPADNSPAAGSNGAGSGGKRLWNVHQF